MGRRSIEGPGPTGLARKIRLVMLRRRCREHRGTSSCAVAWSLEYAQSLTERLPSKDYEPDGPVTAGFPETSRAGCESVRVSLQRAERRWIASALPHQRHISSIIQKQS
jgi:hypothetical protein